MRLGQQRHTAVCRPTVSQERREDCHPPADREDASVATCTFGEFPTRQGDPYRTRHGEESPYGIYEGEVKLVDDVLYWYFLLLAEDRAYSYSRSKLKAYIPPLCECFSLKADLQQVSWVGGATCYQIFPDRFRKGRMDAGVVAGEYSFDGKETTVHSFDEMPLEFA